MASGGVKVEMRGRVGILTLDHPPSNALRGAVPAALLDALAQLSGQSDALVIAGAGVNFSSAVALDRDGGSSALAGLTDAVACCPVPVVAALQGLTMGPGAELALAASARVAAPGARIAFPEIVLGLCPEGGATRRLPALVGAEAALRLFLTGRAVGAEEAVTLGLVDLVSEDLIGAALDLAQRLAQGATLPRPPRDAPGWQRAVSEARRGNTVALPAVGRIIDCVEAALLLSPEMAQSFETVAREDLEASPEADGLRSAAKAERRAATLPPAVARAMGLAVDRVALLGDGPGLAVIARAALARGMPVLWSGASPASLAGLGPTGGRLDRDPDPADLAAAPFQVHARPPGAATLRRVASGAAMLVLDGAEGDLGLAIAPSGKAAELAVLAEESADAIATAVTGLRRIGLPPVLVGQRPVLGQRLLAASDLALKALHDAGCGPAALAEALGRYAIDLPEGEAATPGPGMAPDEIRLRWLAALANEALRLLDLGIARRPSDVDHLLVAGHGFPRWEGGPMHLADSRGLMLLRRDLRLWAGDHLVWSPAPLLDRLIQDGMHLSALDG